MLQILDERFSNLQPVMPKYNNSHDYKILDPVTDYTILIDFVDYILPKYQREDKLKRILKNE